MRKLLASAVAVIVCLPAVLAPAAVAAPTITVGSSLITEPTLKESFSGNSVTVANATVSDPEARAVSPVDGAVVRWRLGPQPGGASYSLDILRPVGAGAYVLAAASTAHLAATAWTEVFPTNLSIKAGDLIGLNVQTSALPLTLSVVPVASPAAQYSWDPALTDSTPASAPQTQGFEVNFNADVRPAPQVTLLSPASGPTGGGTVVKIAGANFSAVSGVAFGSIPAASFSVDSEGAITATAPPAVDGAGPVDVTVTSAVGTSAIGAQDRFTYQAPAPPAPSAAASSASAPQPAAPSCTVPRLTGRQLATSRRLIGQRHCQLGTVLDRKKGPKKVVRQSPKPGTVRPGGSRVNLTLG